MNIFDSNKLKAELEKRLNKVEEKDEDSLLLLFSNKDFKAKNVTEPTEKIIKFRNILKQEAEEIDGLIYKWIEANYFIKSKNDIDNALSLKKEVFKQQEIKESCKILEKIAVEADILRREKENRLMEMNKQSKDAKAKCQYLESMKQEIERDTTRLRDNLLKLKEEEKALKDSIEKLKEEKAKIVPIKPYEQGQEIRKEEKGENPKIEILKKEFESLLKDWKDINSKVIQQKQEKIILEEEVKSLKSKVIKNTNKLNNNIAESTKRLEDIRNEKIQIEKQLSDVTSKLEKEKQELGGEIEKLKEDKNKLVVDKKKYEDRCAELTKNIKEKEWNLKECTKKFEEEKKRSDDFDTEFKGLQNCYKAYESRVIDFRKNRELFDKELKEVKTNKKSIENESIQEIYDIMMSRYHSKKNKMTRLSKEVVPDKIPVREGQVKNENKDLEEQRNTLAKEIDELQKEKNKLETDIDELQNKKKKNDIEERKIDKKPNDYRSLRPEPSSNQDNKVKKLNETIVSLNKVIKESVKKFQGLKREIVSMKKLTLGNLAVQADELKKLTGDVKNMAKIYKRKKDEFAAIERKMNEYNDHKDEIDTFGPKLAEKKEELEKIESKVNNGREYLRKAFEVCKVLQPLFKTICTNATTFNSYLTKLSPPLSKLTSRLGANMTALNTNKQALGYGPLFEIMHEFSFNSKKYVFRIPFIYDNQASLSNEECESLLNGFLQTSVHVFIRKADVFKISHSKTAIKSMKFTSKWASAFKEFVVDDCPIQVFDIDQMKNIDKWVFKNCFATKDKLKSALQVIATEVNVPKTASKKISITIIVESSFWDNDNLRLLLQFNKSVELTIGKVKNTQQNRDLIEKEVKPKVNSMIVEYE